MNRGPSATLGIMFSVTNKGSSDRLIKGDQLKITASATPTAAPSEKPPRISIAVTARLDTQAYLACASVASVASGEGRMNFGTWNASTRTSQSRITPRCTIRMIVRDRTDRAALPATALSMLRFGSTDLRDRSLSWLPGTFNHLVD